MSFAPSFLTQLKCSSALGYALSQTVFITKIFHVVEADDATQGISRSDIIAAGATNLRQLSSNPLVVEKVRAAYADGIENVLIVALVSACLAHLPLLGMEWLKYPVASPDDTAGNHSTETEDDAHKESAVLSA